MDRLTHENLAAFVSEVSAETSPRTAAAYVNGVGMAIEAMHPDTDITWFWEIANRLKRAARPVKSKRHRILHSGDLFALGVELMQSARTKGGIDAALQFRDGLMVAMLSARPLRLKNFRQIELGTHLVAVGKHYELRFTEADTKTHMDLEFPLQEELTDAVSEYLLLYRPVLLASSSPGGPRRGAPSGEALWIARGGTHMCDGAISMRISQLTEEHRGRVISPHLFRDCAATSIATDCPEQFAIAAQLLGHTTLATTEKYYNQAETRKAASVHQNVIAKLRRSLPRQKRICRSGSSK